jgi:hypothetical protein
MNSKVLNLIASLIILLIGVAYLRSSMELGIGDPAKIGAGFYPFLLAVILLILIVVNFLQTLRKPSTEEDKVVIPNGKLVLFTIGTIALFILSWAVIGYFYINLFLFIFVLYSVYSEKLKRQFIFKNAFLSLLITLSIFVIFSIVLNLPL